MTTIRATVGDVTTFSCTGDCNFYSPTNTFQIGTIFFDLDNLLDGVHTPTNVMNPVGLLSTLGNHSVTVTNGHITDATFSYFAMWSGGGNTYNVWWNVGFDASTTFGQTGFPIAPPNVYGAYDFSASRGATAFACVRDCFDPVVTPLPGAIGLFSFGLATLAYFARRRA